MTKTIREFNKILVANRGEIAVRIIKTAKELGYRTVAVYSQVEASALHVQLADEAVCIGPAPVNKSYLNIESIIAAAKQTSADAIHPGYGFLSENASFAQTCLDNQLIFIGPSPEAIALMGSKRLAKIAMIAAGVPCIPGCAEETEGTGETESTRDKENSQYDATLIKQASKIGYPLMIKASAGGGGRGMRLVQSEQALTTQLKTARSEALNAFGNDELIIEKALINPRHIEIQIFADSHGNVVHLGERDCSIQRRHQKVIEEAPSPAISAATRQKMGEAAIKAAQTCDYVGAGTVEFLYTDTDDFYFLEMNTRLQVEHPVTEMITNTDLVAWQIQIAAGQKLSLRQEDITITGHAIEARLYAEDPANQFFPQTGQVHHWQAPNGKGIRIDHGITEGQKIGTHYDAMLGKVIAYGENRTEAIRKLEKALSELTLLGVKTNQAFLSNIVKHPIFVSGQATTAFIETDFAQDDSLTNATITISDIALAAVLLTHRSATSCNLLPALHHWRNNASTSIPFTFQTDSATNLGSTALCINARLTTTGNGDKTTFNVSADLNCAQKQCNINLLKVTENACEYIEDGIKKSTHFALIEGALTGNQIHFTTPKGNQSFIDTTYTPAQSEKEVTGELHAAMDGAIVAVEAKMGEQVKKDQTLIVMEAMKMELPLKADCDGTLTEVLVSEGTQVKNRQLLMTVKPTPR